MKNRTKYFFSGLRITGFSLMLIFSCTKTHALPIDSALVKNLRQHIYFLASDKLKGRNTGSKGERMASDYLIKQYKQIGIAPEGTDGYLQPFTFNYGRKVTGKNQLTINGISLKADAEYYPVNVSGNGSAKGRITDVGFGIVSPELQYNSYKNLTGLKGSIFLIECSTPEGDNPHSQYASYADLNSKIENAKKNGAIAIIFTNTQLKAEDLKANLDINASSSDIPIVFLKSTALKKVWRNEFNGGEITTHLEKITITGHNVVAYLDNGAATTIVIGAHFDHLGYGEYGNSLYRGTSAIHNGADDNASGTAGIIELARYFKDNGLKEKNNFIFLNFSGEELGLIGSKYWVHHPTYDTSKINYMVNMDMIGRYNPDKGIEVSGLGTSPEAFAFIETFAFNDLKCKPDENGTGPSDHTSFYYANIPVLNFFTGTHEDYHKPTDDAGKINFTGEAMILQYIDSIVMKLDDDGTLSFSKTTESEQEEMPQFKVRLGIIPDYLYDKPGLRVDGVDQDKPASIAGIKQGDVITSIDDHQVSDIMSYMKALAAYSKGDSAKVTVRRNEESIKMEVIF